MNAILTGIFKGATKVEVAFVASRSLFVPELDSITSHEERLDVGKCLDTRTVWFNHSR